MVPIVVMSKVAVSFASISVSSIIVKSRDTELAPAAKGIVITPVSGLTAGEIFPSNKPRPGPGVRSNSIAPAVVAGGLIERLIVTVPADSIADVPALLASVQPQAEDL